ncbi:MAG TPA: LuxR C-terminal-related transcriptional regulator [Iamia sp.]
MGTLPLVAAKLAAPIPPGTLLDRERLYRRLDHGLGARLTLVVGPAGAGKSALVAGWTASRSAALDRAWVNADAGDTSIRLIRHIGAAVGGPRSATALDPSRSGLHTDLVRRVGRRLVIVVDDVHLLRSRHALELLGALAAESPPHVHVVLVSRSDPHVGTTWRTGPADVVEIRGHDLRLTDAEVAEIVRGHDGVDLDEEGLAEITDKVDGWAAGLQLALGAMARSDDPVEIARTFGASTPAVADYLLDEVLDQLDPNERALLLDASVLEDLTGPDRRRATGRDDIDDVLSSLADRNLLIERYTDDSFRCHPLLRQLLQLRLRQEDEARFVRLHRLAAGGAEVRGDLAGAVEHLLVAGAPRAALALCRRRAPAFLAAGAGPLLVEWLGRLPDHDLDADEQLAIAALLLDAGDVIGCALRLERCRPTVGAEPSREMARRLVQLQGECHHRLGEPEPALACARRAQALAGGPRPPPETAAPMAFGLLWEGHIEAARDALAPAPAGDPVTLGLAARIAVEAGDLPEAAALVRRAVVAEETPLAPGDVCLHARVAHAQLAVERLDEPDAEEVVEALIAEATRRGSRGAAVVGLCLRARVRWTRICVSAGIGALGYRSHVGLDRPLGALVQARLDRTEARLLVEAGDLAEAHRLLDGSPADRATAVLRCRAWAAAGDVGRALAELEALGSGGEGGAAVARARARVLADDGDDRAAAAVADLVADPATRHLRRTYLEEGERFDAVLRASGREGEAIAAELDGARRSTAVTALSTRELTVLQYLPTRLTNQEIGVQIFVSANTVKTHLKNLYRRLGVGSRDEAVRRARELGLLPPGRDDALARFTTAALGPAEGGRSPAPAAAGPAHRCG